MKKVEKVKRFTDDVGEFVALEHSAILNEKLKEELVGQIEKFSGEDMDFLNEWLIGERSSEKLKS